MHRNRTILWALLLIGIGVFLLLQNAGVIDEKVEVWPLVLVAIGVWLLLERALFGSRWGGGYVWPLLLIGVGGVLFLQDLDALPDQDILVPIIIIAIGLGLALSAISQARSGDAQEQTASVSLDGASEASVRLDHGAGRLRLSSMVGGDDLLEGRFAGGVQTDSRRSGDRLDVTLRAKPGVFPWGRGRHDGFSWELALNRRVPLALELMMGANEADLDLTDLQVTDLSISTGASKIVVRLPVSGRYPVRIRGGATNIRVHVPTHVAARIESHSGVSGVRIDERRFPRWGAEWRSPDYDTAEHRADIRLEVGAASVEVL